MPVKIRLARHGRKRLPFYHIVVADSRAPRDGKSIEKIGSYNPNTNPATIELNFDSALDWLQKGAQPTDTCRNILSENGVLLKKHLLEGVKKGAFNVDAAEDKFNVWMKDKESKVKATIDKLNQANDDVINKRSAAETKINEERLKAISKKKSDLLAQLEAAEKEDKAEATPSTEANAESKEAVVQEESVETAVETKEEAPTPIVEEAKEEEVKAEVKEEVKEEVKPEAKAKEEIVKAEEKAEDSKENKE